MNRPTVNKVDIDQLPPEVRAKFEKKTMKHPGSFTRPEGIDEFRRTGKGIGGGSSENQDQKQSAPKNENKQSYAAPRENEVNKKEESSENSGNEKTKTIDTILDLCSKVLTESQLRKVFDIFQEPEDFSDKLGIKFSDEDINLILFKGEIEKEIDILKNGKVIVTLKSLTKKERDQVSLECNKAIKEGDPAVHNRNGLDNFKSKRLLALSLISVNGENVGYDSESKLKYIDSQSDWIYEHLISSFNLFVFAINEALTIPRIKKA